MANRISYTIVFEKYFKRYAKKYRSLSNDIKELESILLENPKLGIDLGNGLFKIRLAVKSKNKGKSGGFRVITYLLTENAGDSNITLLILNDKSDIEDIPKSDLLDLIDSVL